MFCVLRPQGNLLCALRRVQSPCVQVTVLCIGVLCRARTCLCQYSAARHQTPDQGSWQLPGAATGSGLAREGCKPCVGTGQRIPKLTQNMLPCVPCSRPSPSYEDPFTPVLRALRGQAQPPVAQPVPPSPPLLPPFAASQPRLWTSAPLRSQQRLLPPALRLLRRPLLLPGERRQSAHDPLPPPRLTLQPAIGMSG